MFSNNLADKTKKQKPQNKRLIRRPEVQRRVALGRSAIYEKMARGEFPKPVHLGDRAVAWVESEIDQWVEDRISARGES